MSRQSARRTSVRAGFAALGMFGFGFAMVPLYDKLCEITGLGGRTNDVAIAATSVTGPVDEQRLVNIEFVTSVNNAAPWEFSPPTRSIKVHPGKFTQVDFHAESLSEEPTSGQAVPSVAPAIGSAYFQKIECFCFTRQDFKPFESKSMPVTFRIDPKLPAHIDTLTLSYTFFTLDTSS